MVVNLSNRHWAVARIGALALVAVPTTLMLLHAIIRSCLKIQINSNEGWNAFWTQRLLHGEPLYAPANSLVLNNYPPLSFIFVSFISRLGLDPLVAGRIVAWASLIGCAFLIFRMLQGLRAGLVISIFASSLYLGFLTTQYASYIGMFDPQFTAQFLMLLGASLLLREQPNDAGSIAVAAVLMVIGGFFKHSLIALPMTITIWLAVFDSRRLWVWLVASALSLAVGFGLFRLMFGHDFIVGLLTPRVWSLRSGMYNFIKWSWPIEFAAFVGFAPLFAKPRDRFALCFALFVVSSSIEAFVGGMGERVSYNAVFDLVAASCLGFGYAITSRHGEAETQSNAFSTWASLTCAVAFVFATTEVGLADEYDLREWRLELTSIQNSTQIAVASLRSRPGPALCQDLVLCYWAQKPMTLDVNAYVESVRSGQKTYDELVHLLDTKYFSSIELARSAVSMDPAVQAAIAGNYDAVDVSIGPYRVWQRKLLLRRQNE